MIKLKTLLFENVDKSNVQYWYHGRTVKNDTFSLNYVGGESATDQEGPGFYFTSNFESATGYAYPQGIVLKCKLNYKKIITKYFGSDTKANKKIIVDLINSSPNKNDTLENFDENPKIAFINAINVYLQQRTASDAYQTIANDFYKHNPKEYVTVLSKYYDGQLTKLNNSLYGDVYHFIVYKTDIITVLERVDL